MELVREKEFVNQYHYDARNLKWEEKMVPQRQTLRLLFN